MLAAGAMEFLEMGTRGWSSLKLIAIGARKSKHGISSQRCQRHPLTNHISTASITPTLTPTHVQQKPDLMRHAEVVYGCRFFLDGFCPKRALCERTSHGIDQGKEQHIPSKSTLLLFSSNDAVFFSKMIREPPLKVCQAGVGSGLAG